MTDGVAEGSVRRIGLRGAVGIGVGSMLGAGVFAVWSPAAQAAGQYLLYAVALAAVIATANALSTSWLAARHPVAGGAYAFGTLEVHPVVGYIAGLGFVVGKTASLAAMGLTIGAYVWPGHSAIVATAALLAAWALNALGVTRTAAAATIIGAAVLVALTVFVIAGAGQPAAPTVAYTAPTVWWGPAAMVVAGAALVFFAFAGYARVATLGEEVREPRRNIPLAVGIALAIVLLTYGVVALSLLRRPGLAALPDSVAPLAELVQGSLVPASAVAVVAATASFGVMVALGAGVGRTAMAMARDRNLPAVLARRGARGVPWIAEAVATTVAIALAWIGDLTFALSMSAFAVLIYYAIANLAAMRARRAKNIAVRKSLAWIPWLGLIGCVAFALALPLVPVLAAIALGLLAVALRWFVSWLGRTREAIQEADARRAQEVDEAGTPDAR